MAISWRSALLAIALSAIPFSLVAQDGNFRISSKGYVMTKLDRFTDAYSMTVLVLADPKNTKAHGVFFFFHGINDDGSDEFGTFWLPGTRYDPVGSDTIELTYRIDDRPAVTLIAFRAGNLVFGTPLISDDLLAALVGAEVLIYRVGTGGEIMTVLVPDEMDELIAEFRRRVAQETVAS